VYVTGQTGGIFPGETGSGGVDAFLQKYDAAGNDLGTRQFGTSAFVRANGIAVDVSGLFVAGETNGAFQGETNAGGVDAFLAAPLEPPLPAAEPRPPDAAQALLLGFLAGGTILVAAVVAAVYLSRRRKKPGSQAPAERLPPMR
jgi:hypothetical protein